MKDVIITVIGTWNSLGEKVIQKSRRDSDVRRAEAFPKRKFSALRCKPPG